MKDQNGNGQQEIKEIFEADPIVSPCEERKRVVGYSRAPSRCPHLLSPSQAYNLLETIKLSGINRGSSTRTSLVSDHLLMEFSFPRLMTACVSRRGSACEEMR